MHSSVNNSVNNSVPDGANLLGVPQPGFSQALPASRMPLLPPHPPPAKENIGFFFT